jgi:hypothetical protein
MMKVMLEYEDADVQGAIDAHRVLTNEYSHPGAHRRATLGEDESESELQLNLCDSRPVFESFTLRLKLHCTLAMPNCIVPFQGSMTYEGVEEKTSSSQPTRKSGNEDEIIKERGQ